MNQMICEKDEAHEIVNRGIVNRELWNRES